MSSSASASGISTSRAKYNAATTIAPPANVCSDVDAVPCVAVSPPRAAMCLRASFCNVAASYACCDFAPPVRIAGATEQDYEPLVGDGPGGK